MKLLAILEHCQAKKVFGLPSVMTFNIADQYIYCLTICQNHLCPDQATIQIFDRQLLDRRHLGFSTLVIVVECPDWMFAEVFRSEVFSGKSFHDEQNGLVQGTTSPEPVYTHLSTLPFLMRAWASVSNLPNIV